MYKIINLTYYNLPRGLFLRYNCSLIRRGRIFWVTSTPEKIRNVVIAGHGGSGKTMLAESILYTTGAVNRLGKIEEGSTTSDYSKDEVSRKISINSSVLNTNLGRLQT